MNKVIEVGRLTKDPELKQTGSGKSVSNFSIAVDRRFKQEDQPSADFFNVTAWGKQAEVIHQYMKKGSQIAIEGRLQQRTYQAKDGSKRNVVEIVLENFDFIGNKKDSNSIDEDFKIVENEDDLPF